LTDFRVVSADAGLEPSLSDAEADGLTFFTGPVDDECPEPDGFFADLVVDTSSLTTSVLVSSSDADSDGVVIVDAFTDPGGVVIVDPFTELDGGAPVGPVPNPDGGVPVAPATVPDGVEVVPVVVDASGPSVAHATPVAQDMQIADPIPSETAKAPSRPI
jgi:hypothetical protein